MTTDEPTLADLFRSADIRVVATYVFESSGLWHTHWVAALVLSTPTPSKDDAERAAEAWRNVAEAYARVREGQGHPMSESSAPQ